MTLREYKPQDSKIICSWIKDQKSLFQWSADRIGIFPLKGDELNKSYAECNPNFFIPLTALDDSGNVAGHLFIRYPNQKDKSTVRFGFVIISPDLRGKGNGRKMLEFALAYAKDKLGAQKVTLGVFENNPSARRCYDSLGFVPTSVSTMNILGEEWNCVEMELNS